MGPARAFAVALACMLFASTAYAARDRTAPSTPLNLRFTSVSAYAVALAWDAASDNSGKFYYRLSASDGRTFTIAQTSTNASVSHGLRPGSNYTFCVYAVDAAGNRSRSGSCASARLPLDVTPPSTPALTTTYVGSERVSLSFGGTTDDGPSVAYEVWMDGAPLLATRSTSVGIDGLPPNSSHTFRVRAADGAGNVSALSNVVQVTLADSGAFDQTPPSAPRGLTALDGYCGDVLLYWIASVDDHDDASTIRYEVYVDGDFAQGVVGQRSVNLLVDGAGLHTFEVIAIDSAGNLSASGITSLDVEGCD